MTRLTLGTGLLLAIASVLLAVLAVQAWRYPAAAARQDALIERAPERAWTGGRDPAEALVGARDDAALRRAIALYRSSRPDVPGGNKSAEQLVSSLEASILLSRIVRGGAPRERRSQAANLQAILLAEDAVFEPDARPRVTRAERLLRRAIALDPGNAAAKSNLELLYGYSGPESSATDESDGFGGFGDDAGAGRPGSGY